MTARDVLLELVVSVDKADELRDALAWDDLVEAEKREDRAWKAARAIINSSEQDDDAHWLRVWGDDEMARGNVSNAQRFIEIADRLEGDTP